MKKELSGNNLGDVINYGHLIGFPNLLGYKFTNSHSEIMMTHGGNSLLKWQTKLSTRDMRINFAAEMLK